MRFLFTFVGGQGHFDPLVPIARAGQDAGHRVDFACRASMVQVVRGAGFGSVVAVGPDVVDLSSVIALPTLEEAHEERVLALGFAEITATHRARDLIALGTEQTPEVIVSDEVDFGALIAAEVLGIPWATVIVLAAGGFARTDLLTAPLNRVRAAFDLPPDPHLEMLSRHLVLVPGPPSFRDPAFGLPPTAVAIQPGSAGGHDGRSSPWPARVEGRPRVYVTLGTIFNMESGDLFSRLLDAVADLPADVLVTVGRTLDPATLGPGPPHVTVRPYIPQAAVLDGCDLVVCHGGSGSVIGALTEGVPLVVLPMGGDQPHNARRCATLGVGVTVDAITATPAAIRVAINKVLGDPAYRRRAVALQHEAATLPTASDALALLERLATHAP